jgi:hypothetical protein
MTPLGELHAYIELLDTLDFMTIAGLHQAAIIGTSRRDHRHDDGGGQADQYGGGRPQ